MFIKIKEKLISFFWNNNFVPESLKTFIHRSLKRFFKNQKNIKLSNEDNKLYIKQIIDIQKTKLPIEINKDKYEREKSDVKIIAYYLPQYYPTEYNDKWWGKGATEWTNVSKSMPQYIGHYQPRLPADLGFYDLRIDENIVEQVNLAREYAIYGFCFYFYSFDGKRLLDVPLDKFVNNKNIDFPFCLCWCNENWTKQWAENSDVVLMEQSKNVDNYKNFVRDIEKYITHKNYIKINGKAVLVIYRPRLIPNAQEVIKYWRDFIKTHTGEELYIIAAAKDSYKFYEKWEWDKLGFDAMSEFLPGIYEEFYKDITKQKKFVTNYFTGKVYDYEDLVNNRKLFSIKIKKMYKSVFPMWDNTARRANNSIIFDGSNPELFEKMVYDTIVENKSRTDLDDNIIFVNAWNEWSEGAYLEPDRKYGKAYLNAILNAVTKSRF